jgi:hypothetical protein
MTKEQLISKGKITKATVKAFVKAPGLFIKVMSRFDGMTDACQAVKDTIRPVSVTDKHIDHTLGIDGAWFVNGSREYFEIVADGSFGTTGFYGIRVDNSCGWFLLLRKNT